MYRLVGLDEHDNVVLVREARVRATSQKAMLQTLERWTRKALQDPKIWTVETSIVED